MAIVLFFTEKTQFKLSNPRKTSLWIDRICQSENAELESLNYIFCNDALLSGLNKKYLNHSTLTDILTFNYSDSGRINGEIYISITRVKENAKTFGQSFDSELRRVIAHGLLHLLGYKDKTRSEKDEMRRKEEACLSLWK
jgi:probable rRNA maturation factor